MSWHDGPLVMFDVETTGVDPHRDRIVTAAVISHEPGRDVIVHEWLLDPGIEIPASAAAIHGITGDIARATGRPAPEVTQAASTLISLCENGSPVVGHNVSFDLTMLWAECIRHGRPDLADELPELRVIDTMVLDKWADPWRPKAATTRRPEPPTAKAPRTRKHGSRRLVDTCAVYGIPLSVADAHGAVADALAAGRLAWRLAREVPGLTGTARELHEFQIGEKRAQAESFAEWLLKQGKPSEAAGVSRDWPIVPMPHGWTPDQLPTHTEAVPA